MTRNKFIVSRNAVLYRGLVDENRPHSHYAVQLTLGLNHPFLLVSEGREELCRTAVIQSNQIHTMSGRETDFVFVLAEPLSPAGVFIHNVRTDTFGGDSIFPENILRTAGCLIDQFNGETPTDNLVSELLKLLGMEESPPRAGDRRVADIMHYIRDHIESSFTVPSLAKRVGLSESRLQHLFREHAGLPLTRYILWERIKTVVQIAGGGGDLTTAAVTAGFSDAAHLSRTFKDMFGLNPSKILKESRFIQVYSE